MSGYLMESEAEACRLLAQARDLPVRSHLVGTGLAPGMAALDAGCGPGLITSLMAELVGPQGSVVGLDLSAPRLAQARALCASLPTCRFVQADVYDTGLPEASFDYVWSQYVFEYLREPRRALDELLRLTRPGGRLVVADVDGLGDRNWPFPPELREGLARLTEAVTASGLDLHVGRKLFHLFRQAGLCDVQVHLAPVWVVAGAADSRLLEDWRIRFSTLEPLGVSVFGSPSAYHAFCVRYLEMLSEPDTLKYAVLLITEGRKR